MKKLTVLLAILLCAFTISAQHQRFLVDDEVGTVAVNYGGSQGNGFLVMPPHSDINNMRYGPWLGGMLYDGVGGRGFGFMGDSGEPELWARSSSLTYTNPQGQVIPHTTFKFGVTAPSSNVRVISVGLSDNDSTYSFAATNHSETRTFFNIRDDGQISIESTDTPEGITGMQFIRTVAGSVNFSPGASELTVFNPLSKPSSKILDNLKTDTNVNIRIISYYNYFTIKLDRPAEVETRVGFVILN